MSHENTSTPRKIAIIGSGSAGLAAARSARAQDSEAEISIFSEDSRLPYYRLRLCEYIGRSIDYDKIGINPVDWYAANRIDVHLSSKVTALDIAGRQITAAGGVYSFDSLVVATGSTPIMPPFTGRELKGVHSLWTCEDVAGINEELLSAKTAVVIGGGLLGLETAYMISKLGITVTLIEGMPRLLPKQLDEAGSAVFLEKVKSLGIKVVCGINVSGFKGDGGDHVRETAMADGSSFNADIVVVSVGVAPNTGLCSSSGLTVDRYISVNDRMETNIGFIYAAGDVASFSGRWSGQWSVAGSQGQIAGTNAAGGDAVYKILNTPYSLPTMETRVVCSGDLGTTPGTGDAEHYEFVRQSGAEQFSYSCLVFKDRLFAGYMLIGEPAKSFNKLQTLIGSDKNKDTISEILYPAATT
ncbi:MAG: NAD(P)/FAD-dependent oxidoreductase [Saccharofermentanales bacterium]